MSAYLDPRNFAEGPVFALVGASAYEVAPDELPDDSEPFVYLGGDWGGTWRLLGFATQDGISHGGLAPEQTPQMTSQQRNAASTIRGTRTPTVGLSLLEMTAENFAMAIGGANITDTATAEDVEISDEVAVQYVALGIEAFGPNGRPLRIIYPVMTVAITAEIVHTIGTNVVLPVTFSRAGGVEGNPHWHFLKAA